MTFFTDAWHDIVAGITHPKEELQALREALDKKGESLLANPGPLRTLFGLLRRHDPIVTVGKLAIISRYDDVLEVLKNNEAFSVTEIYLKKMEITTGDFVLGLPDDAQYEREIGIMRDVVKPDDVARIDSLSKQWAEEQVAGFAASGRIDAVEGLSRIVPTRLVEEYFGTPGPDRATLQRWMRVIFREIFLNIENDPGMQAEAVKAGVELNAYLNGLIAERKAQIAASPDAYDDFTSRLIKLQIADPARLDDDTIRRIIGGTIVGTVDTNSKAIAQALDQLLDRPLTLSAAHDAAVADSSDFDSYIWEALRFNPQNPFLIRHCEKDTVVAAGTDREKTIKAGSTVIVGTTSAMFDDLVFPEPNDFRTDRPFDKYIHFGYGQHTCFGRYFAERLIPQTAKALLKKSGLRRAEGADGHIRYDGAFPDSLIVEFDKG